jgi:hypothetical protein
LNIRNKLTIEGKLIGNAADAFFHMLLYIQSWRVLVRPRDRALLDLAVDEVRRLHARARATKHIRPASGLCIFPLCTVVLGLAQNFRFVGVIFPFPGSACVV